MTFWAISSEIAQLYGKNLSSLIYVLFFEMKGPIAIISPSTPSSNTFSNHYNLGGLE
jgi:hypothetical protein